MTWRDRVQPIDVVVFGSGAAVMVVELVVSRLLAPYLGNSIYTWAAVIGVVLCALTLGYYLGGRWSRQQPSKRFLMMVLVIAAISVAMIPLLKDFVLSLASLVGIRWGSLLGAFVLLTVPNVALGCVSPYAIRLRATQVENVGAVAGNLYAWSTAGSIVGTFGTGFLFIPSWSHQTILAAAAVWLLLMALILYQRWWLPVAMVGAMCVANVHIQMPGVIFETDSLYNHIRVIDLDSTRVGASLRVLTLATEYHSVINRNDPLWVAEYLRYYQLDSLFVPEVEQALALGGGAYSGPQDFLRRWPNSQLTVVELDPAVTQTAIDYFDLRPDSRLHIVHNDARHFLTTATSTYDVIYVDVFSSYFALPFHLTTREAMATLRSRLAPNGAVFFNFVSSVTGQQSLFLQAELATLAQVFPQLYLFPVGESENDGRHQNIVVVASNRPERVTKEQLMALASPSQQQPLSHWRTPEIASGPILTDDFAPVDNYIAAFADQQAGN